MAAVLSLVAATVSLWLSCIEHARSIRPSTLLIIYLVFTLLFDVTRARTLWLLRDTAVAAVFTGSTTFRCIVLIIELTEKRHLLFAPHRKASPEAVSSIINRALFAWMNRLLLRGHRSILSSDTLHPIAESLHGDALGNRLLRLWLDRESALLHPLDQDPDALISS